MFDIYDSPHTHDNYKVINFYSHTSNISSVLKTFFEENSFSSNTNTYPKYYMDQTTENEKLKDDITRAIYNSIDGLKILDQRNITMIATRIFHYIISDNPLETPQEHLYIVQVWR